MKTKILEKYKNMPVPARASIWYLICSFLQKGISVISTPVFTRLLNTEEYGKFSVFNSWLSIVTVFVTLRLYYGVYSQGLVKFDKDRNRYSSALLGLTTTMMGGWLCIYLIFHDFWNHIFQLTFSQMIAMFVSIWATAVFSFWAARQRVDYNYRKLVFLTIIVSVAKPLFGICAVLLAEDKVTARIWELALVEVIAYLGLYITQMKKGRCFYSFQIWKYALAFNIPLIPHYLSQTILNASDRIMIERMTTSDAAGIYSLAYSISQIMTLFNTALIQTLTPWIYQKIKAKEEKNIGAVAYPSLLCIGAVNILLICFAPEIVKLFAPKAYYDAIWVIPPVAMSVYFNFQYNLFSAFEFYFEKTSFIALSTGIAAVFNIVLNYVFINAFGYLAAGYTTLVSYMIYAVMHFIFMKKLCKKNLDNSRVYDVRVLLLYSIVFLTIAFFITLTYERILIRYGLIGLFVIILICNRKKIMEFLKVCFRRRKAKA